MVSYIISKISNPSLELFMPMQVLAHLVHQPKSLCNHTLSIIVSVTVTVGVSVGITAMCVQFS